MSRRIRSSIRTKATFWKSSVVAACALAASTAWAQHARVGGSPVHVSAPPVSHAPVYHAPVSYAPIASPRFATGGAIGFATGFNTLRRPIRPFPPVVVVYYPLVVGPPPLWRFDSCWWESCDLFWTLGAVSVPSATYSAPNYVVSPEYVPAPPVYGEVSPQMPQLFLQDGTILSVTDYWVVDGRLHFTMIEQEDGNPVEHDVPFDQLDLQKTIDVNARRGFKFMLRNEPFEQYVRDHPDVPPADAPPHN